VETIGDAYMVVSGLPKPNKGRHIVEICSMGFTLSSNYSSWLYACTVRRSAVWLLISWIKCHASRFVIVRTRHLNYALEYTPDRVLQVIHTLHAYTLIWAILRHAYCCAHRSMLNTTKRFTRCRPSKFTEWLSSFM